MFNLWECSTSTYSQQLFNTDVPALIPGFLSFPGSGWSAVTDRSIRSALNSMCIDVFAFNYDNGAAVVTWPCNNENNQRWSLDIRGLLRSTHNSAKCLDAANVNTGQAASAVRTLTY